MSHASPRRAALPPLAPPAMPASSSQLDTIDGRFTQLVAELEALSAQVEAALAEHGTSKEK